MILQIFYLQNSEVSEADKSANGKNNSTRKNRHVKHKLEIQDAGIHSA